MVALHVHHGLGAHADHWLEHGRALCARWARRGLPLEFAATKLEGRPGAGDSIEAWARQARYRALRRIALERGIDLVLLAHHRRDQAETFLLQALRGGGVTGLSAMPVRVRREGVTWARPWLEMPPEAIEAYVRQHRLAYVDDDSNADTRYARNRLRLEVWPALVAAFPSAEVSLAAAARWAQQASAALAETAAADIAASSIADALDIAAWRSLSPARQSNLLRAWLQSSIGQPPAASLVERLLREVAVRGSMRWPAGGGELRSYRGRLRYQPSAAVRPPGDPAAGMAAGVPLVIDLRRPGIHELAGWGGAIEVRAVSTGGVAEAVAARLEVRQRRPGDRFQAGIGRPARSLKLQYQAAGVPEWQRLGPLLSCDGVLVFVAGLGLDARALAAPGERQVSFAWLSAR